MSTTAAEVRPLVPTTTCRRPLFLSRVQAGFPSPADDFVETGLDLNEHLIQRPASTFFVRVRGDSMEQAGIVDDAVLIVDRADEAEDGDIVVAALDGELTVKRLRVATGCCWLVPENDAHAPIEVTESREMIIWGVVQHVIRSFE
jgi:DNA polymerase V